MFPIRRKRVRPTTRLEVTSLQRREAGRPMKRLRELTTPKGIVNAHLRKLHQRPTQPDPSSRAALSPLERLPNEVIQQIFFNCFEINLPRASAHVAQALSTESTYRALILFAFFDDDGHHPVATKLFLPVIYTPLQTDQRIRLQSGILGCRWCTLDRIKAYLPSLNRLAMIQAWQEEKDEEEFYEDHAMRTHNTHFDRTTTLTQLPDRIREVAQLPVRGNFDEMDRHFFAKADYNDALSDNIREFDSHLPRIVTWALWDREIEDDPNMDISKYDHHRVSTLAARVLPNWLLKGNPWTKGRLELLQLLRQGSRFVHHEADLEVSLDSIVDGISSAIREQNVEALLTLLELHNGAIRNKKATNSSDGVDEEDRNGSHVLDDKPQPHQSLPLYLFHLATNAGAKSTEMIGLLIRGSPSSISHEDVILTAWALERKAEGNKIAHWLLEYMAGTADYEPATGRDLLAGRNLSGFQRQQLFPLAQRPFWEELGYLAPCSCERR